MSDESIYKGIEGRESAADLLRRTREVVKKIALEEQGGTHTEIDEREEE